MEEGEVRLWVKLTIRPPPPRKKILPKSPALLGLKHDHDSHRQNLYVVDNQFVISLRRMLYCHLCQWKIQSLYNLECYFLLFCQGYVQQKEVNQFLIYQEGEFLHYLNGVLNLGLFIRILCYGKHQTRKGKTLFLYLFVCFKDFSEKNIND